MKKLELSATIRQEMLDNYTSSFENAPYSDWTYAMYMRGTAGNIVSFTLSSMIGLTFSFLLSWLIHIPVNIFKGQPRNIWDSLLYYDYAMDRFADNFRYLRRARREMKNN